MKLPFVVSMGLEASTLEGFIQQLAVSYVARGHWFYVTGTVSLPVKISSGGR